MNLTRTLELSIELAELHARVKQAAADRAMRLFEARRKLEPIVSKRRLAEIDRRIIQALAVYDDVRSRGPFCY